MQTLTQTVIWIQKHEPLIITPIGQIKATPVPCMPHQYPVYYACKLFHLFVIFVFILVNSKRHN